MFHSYTVETATKIFKYFKMMGFMSVTIIDGESVTKFTDVLYFLISICSGIFICFVAVLKKDEIALSDSDIADTGAIVTCVMAIIISITTMIIAFIWRHKNWKMTLMLGVVEEKFSKIGHHVDYFKIIQIAYVSILSILVLLILMSAYDYFVENSLLKAFLLIYSSTYFTICITTSGAFVFGILLRLKSMINVFEKMLDGEEITKVKSFDADKKEIKIIRMMIEIYSDLSELYDNVNLCYSFSVMLSYGLVFFHTLFTYFVICKDYKGRGMIPHGSQTSFLYAFFYNTLFLLLITITSLTTNAAFEVVRMSNKMIKQSKDQLKTSLLLGLNSLINRKPPRFTCGLFDFTWTLTLSTISALTTNFLILFQFDIASRNKRV